MIRKGASPDSRHSDFGTLAVLKEGLKEFEEALQMLLKTLDDSFQNSIENVNSDFAMGYLGRYRSFEQEGKELRPSVDRHLDTCDSSNDSGSGVANKGTEQEEDINGMVRQSE